MRAVFSLLLLLTACSEYGLQPDASIGPNAPGELEVSPLSLDFGSLTVGQTSDPLLVEVRNIGRGRLEVEGLELEDGPFALDVVADSFELGPGDVREVPVRFVPQTVGEVEGLLTVLSEDEDERRVEVELFGRGRGPFLQILPETYDFGAAPIPCSDEVGVVLQNIGDATLTVEDVAWETGDDQLSVILEDAAPYELAPGAFSIATVRLDPRRTGPIESRLTVSSTDPRGDRVATQRADPSGAGTKTDRTALQGNPAVDLIVAVDRSASMEDDAIRLADSFGTFVGKLESVTDDWHLGVVTLDSGCFNQGTLTTATPDYTGRFATAVTTGVDRDIADDEALFSLVDRSLRATGTGGCNFGFRRPDAALHVIVVSDEPEQSPDRFPTLTWDRFVASWRDEVSTPSLLKVSGVVDLDACGGGAGGYEPAITETGGLALSICGTDWSLAAASLAEATLARVHSLTLSEEPVRDSLVVEIDGTVTASWRYDADTNTVVLDGPVSGSEMSVSYTIATSCD